MGAALLLTLLGGIANGLQPGLNATARAVLGQPFTTAFASVAGTALALLLAGALSGQIAWPEPSRMAEVPWWAWFAGPAGAVFIMAQIYAARALGAGPFLSVTVATAILTSLLLDHFGLAGFAAHPLNAGRVAGAALIVGGVVLVRLF